MPQGACRCLASSSTWRSCQRFAPPGADATLKATHCFDTWAGIVPQASRSTMAIWEAGACPKIWDPPPLPRGKSAPHALWGGASSPFCLGAHRDEACPPGSHSGKGQSWNSAHALCSLHDTQVHQEVGTQRAHAVRSGPEQVLRIRGAN